MGETISPVTIILLFEEVLKLARRTRDELLQIFREYIGDRNDDATIAIIEDLNDSYPDGEDWKSRYDKLDIEWRNRYRDRFFNAETTDEKEETVFEQEEKEEDKTTKIEDLFEEE